LEIVFVVIGVTVIDPLGETWKSDSVSFNNVPVFDKFPPEHANV
jgi:hypothetical protein